jgi:hypothetical protein
MQLLKCWEKSVTKPSRPGQGETLAHYPKVAGLLGLD